jgi:hypothetical protein
MKVLLLSLSFIAAGSSVAQTDSSYQLLWYKGKKLKPNVLLTTAGDTVRYDPAKRTVKMTSKTGAGKNFDNMLAELNRTPLRMQQMLQELSDLPKPILPPLSLAVKNSFTQVDEEYRKLLSNVITIPAIKIPGLTSQGGKGAAFDMADWDDPWEALVQEFRAYITSHNADNLSNLPEPPRFDFRYCARCDSNQQTAYKKSIAEFTAALMGKDDMAILEKARGVCQQAEGLPDEKKRYVQKETWLLLDFIFKRSRTKVSRIIERYVDDPERALAVMDVAVSTEREQQIMGFGTLLPDYAARAFEAYTKRITKALDEYDYSIALNHDLVFFMERKTQLYNRKIQGLLQRVMKFNWFKMTMDVSAKSGGNNGFVTAALKGDNWLMAYVDNKTCRLNWQLERPRIDKLKMKLTTAELKGDGGEVTYVGTRDWLANAPTLKIDFCEEEKDDSIIAYPFYADEYKELWSFPHAGIMNVSIANSALFSCFIDEERVKEEAANVKQNPDKIERMKKQLQEQYNKFTNSNGAVGTMPASALDMSYLLSIGNATAIGNDIGRLIQAVNPGRYIFTPQVYNKDKVIVKDRIDGKITFPENTATEYALFHITIENDAGGR